MSEINIDDLTIGQLKQIQGMCLPGVEQVCECDNPGSLWEIGKNYFIRTVTMYYTGRLVAVTDHEIAIESAAWIADTGRFMQALQTGNFEEVEPFPEGSVLIGRMSIIDAHKFKGDLAEDQK